MLWKFLQASGVLLVVAVIGVAAIVRWLFRLLGHVVLAALTILTLDTLVDGGEP